MRTSSIEERIAARRDQALARFVVGRTGRRASYSSLTPKNERKASAPGRLSLIILTLLVILWAIA